MSEDRSDDGMISDDDNDEDLNDRITYVMSSLDRESDWFNRFKIQIKIYFNNILYFKN